VVALALVAAPGFAQDGAPARNRTDTDRVNAAKIDSKTTGETVRASQLMGMNIQNEQGESLGEINDLVLDANSGKIRYAAVTYGGFLSVGDKLFAVPWGAFQCRVDPDDRDEYVLVLNVSQEQLEGAQGFDEDHWPNFADDKFTDDLQRRYRVDQWRTSDRNVDVNVDRHGIDVNVDRDDN
jgi:sporulation protein YlmC with PRC-barrel domain